MTSLPPPVHPAQTPTSAAPTRPLKVALIGNPNTGKSTLFNALSGLQSQVGNYPGVTVEKKVGRVRWDQRQVDLIDLPGTYSLAPRSLDEMVSVNVLLGRQADVGTLDAVICIVDASNAERNLYLVSQILDIGLPTVVVLNMWDVAESRGIQLDIAALEQRLGVPVVKTCAHRKTGIKEIQQAVERALKQPASTHRPEFPAPFVEECRQLRDKLADWGLADVPLYLQERLLLDVGGWLEGHTLTAHSAALHSWLHEARARLAEQSCRVPMLEARVRYDWARKTLTGIMSRPAERAATRSDAVDRWLTHRSVGLLVFAALMFVVFQAIYTWATPLMDLCDAAQGWVGDVVQSLIPPGALRSLLVDGVIAGVGGVLIFLPQIALLFLFIALLEDCGYMARAAFLMDKLMSQVGLSGKSFVPLMSSFACAVPGIMATRVIENRRDRMVTILVAPLMSCSARLPVYILLISAFVPEREWLGGWITLHGVVTFAMVSLGAIVAVPIAWLLKSTVFKGETPPFVMELPAYKVPSLWIVLRRVYDQSRSFVVRAGTLIFTMSVLIWAAGYFPGDHTAADRLQTQFEQQAPEYEPLLEQQSALTEQLAETAESEQPDAAKITELEQQLAEVDSRLQPLVTLQDELNARKSQLLEQSFLGRTGHLIEPVVRPLGWDWRIGVGVLASFPAREVIISTLGTIYSLGNDVGEEDASLHNTLKAATWPDGRPVYNLPVALSIMVFFALCAQCASTLLVIQRETNSAGWAIFTFVYMTLLAYAGAWITYQIAGAMWPGT